MSKNSNTGGARKKSPYVENKRNSKIDSKEAISKTVKHGYQSSEPSAKVPIKMTFMKKVLNRRTKILNLSFFWF